MSPGRIAAIGIIAALTGFIAFGIALDVYRYMYWYSAEGAFLANTELAEAVVKLAWVIIGGLLAYKVYANRPSAEPYADEKRTLSTNRAVSLALLLLPASSWAGRAIVDIILYNEFGASAVKFALAAVLVGIAAIVYARRPVHWFDEERRRRRRENNQGPPPPLPRDAEAMLRLDNPPNRRMR